jgi:uncharacterized protein (TIGR03790 family)
VPVAGFVPNPYFHSGRPLSEVKPFRHESMDAYLVTRLDGYTVDDALALIDRSVKASRDGRFIFDERTSWNDRGNNWLRSAAQRLRASGFADSVLLDESGKVITNESRVIGYYSWGSNDPAIRMRRFGFGFVPGALASMFVSTDGRTFREPPAEWTPGEWTDPKTFFVNSPQSLAADFIRDGVTGIAGHVAEPYLEAAIRPDILFPVYTRGLNLAESFYAAMPYLSWQTIVIGDPLCAPFRDPQAPAVTIEAPVDAATELPAQYSRRRQAGLSRSAADDAVLAYLKAEARAARSDPAGSREALERAVSIDPRFTAARLVLAAQHERADEHERASVQYRAILEYAPNDPVALNNLAYNLVAYDKRPEEALPLAERAIKLTPGSAAARDTLAWTQHLLGRDAAAAANIALARDAAKESAEIRWHAAFIYAAINDLTQAEMELEAALKLDPTIANRTELQDLRARLGGKPAAR